MLATRGARGIVPWLRSEVLVSAAGVTAEAARLAVASGVTIWDEARLRQLKGDAS